MLKVLPLLQVLVKFIVYFVIFVVIFSAYICFSYMRPQRFISEINPDQVGLRPYDEVEFTTDDGITLKGWYVHSKNPSDKAIIVCHGYPMDKGNVIGLAMPFHESYNILLFDFRGHGESGGTFTTIGYKETKDFNAAVSYLRGRGIKKVGALGFSMGGAVIIMANNPHISACVSDSAYAELSLLVDVVYSKFGIFKYPFVHCTMFFSKHLYGVDMSKVSPLKAMGAFRTPLFLIHSKVDNLVSFKHSQMLHEANPESLLWIVPQAQHGETHSQSPDEYDDKVLSFFEKHM